MEELQAAANYNTFNVWSTELLNLLPIAELNLFFHLIDLVFQILVLCLNVLLLVDLAQHLLALVMTLVLGQPPLRLGHREHAEQLDEGRNGCQAEHEAPVTSEVQGNQAGYELADWTHCCIGSDYGASDVVWADLGEIDRYYDG